MIQMVQIRGVLVIAGGLLLACSVATAQTRAPVRESAARPPAAIRTRSAAPRPIAVQTARPATMGHTLPNVLPNGQVSSNFEWSMASGNGPDSKFGGVGNTNGVPGLGFDYPHLAAINNAHRIEPSRAFGHSRRHEQATFTPILFGGFPYYGYLDSSDYDQPPQQLAPQESPQPQVIVIQQPAPISATTSAAPPENISPADAPSAAPAPVREVGEFILVKRDGRVLFASAFSVSGSQLQYVSPEGIRHTLPMAEIDSKATVQMNEARGTDVQLRN